MTLISEQLSTLRALLNEMRYVSHGDMVLATDTNLLLNFALTAVEATKILYDQWKYKMDRLDPIVEDCISTAERRLGFMKEVKHGDVVATRDHNIILDVLKLLQIALLRMAGPPVP
jgi:hypothetical protein